MVHVNIYIHHLLGGVKEENMCDDENEEYVIYKTDREEELEKENNPYYQEFLKVKNSCKNIDCLINIILTALNNDFDELDTDYLINYIELIREHLNNHRTQLDNFYSILDFPKSKTKLISLSTYIKPEK